MEPSQQYNPYASPGNLPPQQTMYHPSGNEQVSAQTLIELTGTKPWVRLLAILSWIGSGFLILAVIAMLVMGVTGAATGGAAEGGAMIAISLVYGLIALLMIYPAIKMSAYASRIDDLARSRSVADLEAALSQQRMVWRFYGIIALVYIVLAVVGILAAMVVPFLLKG